MDCVGLHGSLLLRLFESCFCVVFVMGRKKRTGESANIRHGHGATYAFLYFFMLSWRAEREKRGCFASCQAKQECGTVGVKLIGNAMLTM